MTKSTFHGAALLLSSDPGPDRVAQIAQSVSSEHFNGKPMLHSLQHQLPVGMEPESAQQLNAHKAALTPDAVFLVLRPKPGE